MSPPYVQLPYTIHPLVHVLTAVLFAWCAARLFLEWQEAVLHHVLLGSWWKYVSTMACVPYGSVHLQALV